MARVFHRYPINALLPSIIFLRARRFFLLCFFHFHHTLFSWACGSLREPRKFSLFVNSLVCPITHSSLDVFQPNLVQHFPHVCSTCHTVFILKNTLKCVCERLLHCRLNSAITWTPTNHLHKLSVTQSILMYHSVLKVLKKLLA